MLAKGRIEEAHEAIALVLNARLGSTPPEILDKLGAIDELARLHDILEQALRIQSVDQLELD